VRIKKYLVASAGIARDGGEHAPEPGDRTGERARLESESGGDRHNITGALRRGGRRGRSRSGSGRRRGSSRRGSGDSRRRRRSKRRSGRASGGGHGATPCHDARAKNCTTVVTAAAEGGGRQGAPRINSSSEGNWWQVKLLRPVRWPAVRRPRESEASRPRGSIGREAVKREPPLHAPAASQTESFSSSPPHSYRIPCSGHGFSPAHALQFFRLAFVNSSSPALSVVGVVQVGHNGFSHTPLPPALPFSSFPFLQLPLSSPNSLLIVSS
jgi:hypothetical protein